MSSGDALSDMKLTIEEFIGDLRENIFTKEEEGDLLLVEFFFKKMNNEKLMNHIIEHVLPYSKKIKNRKESFFIKKKDHIFAGIPKDKTEYFAKLIIKKESEGGLSDENRQVIWTYFDTITTIAKLYKKEK